MKTKAKGNRYFLNFEPIGWVIRDRETGEEVGSTYGHGKDDYQLAKLECAKLNRASNQERSPAKERS